MIVDSKEFVLAGVVMKRLLSGEQTAGQFCLFENRRDGGTKTPIHVHAKDDETVYVIEGELTAVIDGQPRRLSAGESIFLPRGIPHQLMNYYCQFQQIHLDWDPRSLRPLSRGRRPRTWPGRNRRTADT
jgi:glyoxylate utilization-related uncharacterized protein